MKTCLETALSYKYEQIKDLPTLDKIDNKELKMDLGNIKAFVENDKIVWAILIKKSKRILSWEVIKFPA